MTSTLTSIIVRLDAISRESPLSAIVSVNISLPYEILPLTSSECSNHDDLGFIKSSG